jgi:hypothetical protein
MGRASRVDHCMNARIATCLHLWDFGPLLHVPDCEVRLSKAWLVVVPLGTTRDTLWCMH